MRRRTTILLFGILILATFLRLCRLPDLPPGLYPDEAMNGNNALEAIAADDYKVYYPENNGREGLFINIQAQFLRALLPLTGGNPEPWMLRLPSAIFGILTILGIYFLGKELFSRNVGLLASFFLATSFWHIMFSRIGFRAIMAPFFLVWAAYFFLRALKTEHAKHHTAEHRGTIILAGLFFGLGFYTYIAYRIAPLLFLLFVPFFRKDKNFWHSVAVFSIIAFLTALPIGLYYLQNPGDFLGRTTQVSIFSSETPLKDLGLNAVKTLGMFWHNGDWNQRHNLAGRPELFWPIGILFALGIVIGHLHFFKKSAGYHEKIFGVFDATRANFAYAFLFSWFFLAALPVVVSNEGLPHALRAILMIPPVMLLAACAGLWLHETVRRLTQTFWIPAMSAVFLSLLALEAYTTYFSLWAAHPDTPHAFAADYTAIGRRIRALPRETPKIVVVNAGGVPVRGIPMPAQTVMYLTDTFRPEKQREKNVYYLLPGQESNLPPGSAVFHLR